LAEDNRWRVPLPHGGPQRWAVDEARLAGMIFRATPPDLQGEAHVVLRDPIM